MFLVYNQRHEQLETTNISDYDLTELVTSQKVKLPKKYKKIKQIPPMKIMHCKVHETALIALTKQCPL